MIVNILDVKARILELERMLLVDEMPTKEMLNKLVKDYLLISDDNEEVYAQRDCFREELSRIDYKLGALEDINESLKTLLVGHDSSHLQELTSMLEDYESVYYELLIEEDVYNIM